MAVICPVREAGCRPAGACGFPVDPSLDALEADVFWRPEVAPAAVVLLAPMAGVSGDAFEFGLTPRRVRMAEEGDFVRLSDGSQVLLLGGARIGDPLSVVVPLDGMFDVRIATAQALWARLWAGDGPTDGLTDQRRLRLRRMLRASDGRMDGASYRDVAESVLGETFQDSMSWRTSSVRDVAIRLCRGAAELIRDGYLALLRRRS